MPPARGNQSMSPPCAFDGHADCLLAMAAKESSSSLVRACSRVRASPPGGSLARPSATSFSICFLKPAS